MNKQNFTYTFLSHTDIMLGTGRNVLGEGGGGPEHRGGRSSFFEPLERDGRVILFQNRNRHLFKVLYLRMESLILL